MTSIVPEGWLNIAVYSHDLEPLINPRVVIEITEAMVDVVTGIGAANPRPPRLPLAAGETMPNWYGFQINCNSPPPTAPAAGYEQFVSEHEGFALQNITLITANSAIFADGFDSGPALPQPIPAGYKWDITINTDPVTRNVVSSSTIIYDPSGAVVTSVTMPVSRVTSYPSGGPFDPAWAAPITSLSVQIVGTGETSATYTSGAGIITYVPGGGQTYDQTPPTQTPGVNNGNPYYPFPAGLPIANNTIHTSENSNQKYDAILEADGVYPQFFSWDGKFPMLTLTMKPVVS